MAGEFNAGAVIAELKLNDTGFTKGLKKAFEETNGFTKGLFVAGAAAVSASGAVAFLTQQSADYIDSLGKQAQMIGQTTEQLSSYALVAELSDVSTEEFGKSIELLSKKMSEAAGGSQQAIEAFTNLGISVKDSDGKLKNSGQVLEEIADKFSETEDSATKTAAAMDLMGKSGAKMIPLLDSGAEEIRNMRQEAERMGLVFGKDAFDAAQKFNDSQTRVKESLVGLRNKFSETIISLVNQSGVFDALSEKIQSITSWWRSLSEEQQKFILKGAGLVASVLAVTAAVAGLVVVVNYLTAAMLANPVGLIVVGITALVAATIAAGIWIADLVDHVNDLTKVAILAGAIIAAPVVALVAAIVLVIKHWDMLKARVEAFYLTVKPVLEKFAGAIAAPFKLVYDFASSVFSKIGGLIDAIFKNPVIESFAAKITGFINSLKSFGQGFQFPDFGEMIIRKIVVPFNTGFDVISRLLQTFPSIFSRAMESALKIVQITVIGIKQAWEDAFNDQVTMGQMLANFGNSFQQIKKEASAMATDVVGKVTAAVNQGFADGKAEADALIAKYNKLKEAFAEANDEKDKGQVKAPGGNIQGAVAHVPIQFEFADFNVPSLIQSLTGGLHIAGIAAGKSFFGGFLLETDDFKEKQKQVMDEAVASGAKDGGQKAGEDFGNAYTGAAANAISQTIGAVTSGIMSSLNATATLMAQQQANLVAHTDFSVSGIEFLLDQQLAATQRELDAELDALNAQKDAMIEAEQKYQDRLKEMRDEFAAEREAQLNEQLRGEFDRLQALYEAQVATFEKAGLSQVDLDSKKSDALAELEGKKNQLIAESKKGLAADIEENNKKLDKDAKESAENEKKREQALADQIKAVEKQKQDAEDETAQKKEDLQKAAKIFEWASGRGAFEVSKKAQIAQAQINMAMGIQNAINAGIMASSIPIVGFVLGPALGIALTAMAIKAGTSAIQAASSQQYPPPPVFASGGMATTASIFGESGKFGTIGGQYGTELAIPANNPGKDFGALKTEVARELVGGKGDITLNVYNTFTERDDYETIKMKLSEDYRDMIRSARDAA